MALEKIRNKSMIGVVRIPVSDKVLQFVSHRGDRNVDISEMKIQLSPSCSKKKEKKKSRAHERSCYTSWWGCA